MKFTSSTVCQDSICFGHLQSVLSPLINVNICYQRQESIYSVQCHRQTSTVGNWCSTHHSLRLKEGIAKCPLLQWKPRSHCLRHWLVCQCFSSQQLKREPREFSLKAKCKWQGWTPYYLLWSISTAKARQKQETSKNSENVKSTLNF